MPHLLLDSSRPFLRRASASFFRPREASGPHARRLPALVGALLFFGAAGCDDGPTARSGASATDADGDFLTDVQEGAEEGRDTDRDGIPDYFDLDSDGDGILDPIEAGDMDPETSPIDSDDDGVPDFQDLDSDGNGIPDRAEAYVDLQGAPTDVLLDAFGDGIPDYRDLDDDEDLLLDVDELGTVPDSPLDADGDGIPNYRDPDSDDDGILDGHDRLVDTDQDGLRNAEDEDTDNDGIPDIEEAGDDDIRTLPIDTDGDGTADFEDLDSDDDGLADARERALGTDPRSADSDGDGVPDLIEVVACFDPATGCESFPSDPNRSPRTEGNFVFVMPFEAEPTPTKDTLRFATDLRVADVYFLMDTTGSMGGAIDSLKSSIATPGTGLIDRLRETIPEAWFGVGDFKDYSTGGYGGTNDYAYRHRLDISESAVDAQDAVNELTASGGSDLPESHGPALWAMATGNALPGSSDVAGGTVPGQTECPRGTSGYPCFRSRAVPIAVLFSDVPMHNGPGGAYAYDNGVIGGPAPTFVEVVAALQGARIRFVGVTVRQNEEAIAHKEAIARGVGSVDGDDEPFVTTWTPGSPISDVVVDQIEQLARGARFDVTIEFEDGPEDAVDTESAFLERIEAVDGGEVAECPFRVPVDADADGVNDTFLNVGGGSFVCFDVFVKENRVVDETPEPQLFRATLRVKGDGFTDLDVRDIYFLVPPDPELGGIR
ncbi:MAG TPA: hypothetical protein RMF84_05160 [Polyangiaceae bacterium LLY-WYZ-14_1]|nr:hypothetical protein [Polyangiaceae bacterium LLY-WYZ-14_1]